jgi:hypothetical protein
MPHSSAAAGAQKQPAINKNATMRTVGRDIEILWTNGKNHSAIDCHYSRSGDVFIRLRRKRQATNPLARADSVPVVGVA